MRAKPVVLLIVALGCGMIAAVAASKAVLNKGPDTAAEATVEIFVAVKDLSHGQQMSAENVKLERWPKSRLPEGALVKLEQLNEKFTNQVIFAGEPILERKLNGAINSFSNTLLDGYRVFNISADASSYIKPGDHVDILGTFSLGGRNSVPESATVMRNVKVHGINGVTVRDSDETKGAKTVTFQLMVKTSQLETLALAHKLGDLQLHLVPFAEAANASNQTDTGAEFLNWIDQSREPEIQPATQPSLLTSLPNPRVEPEKALAAQGSASQESTSTHEMAVITPNGVVRYRWDDNNSLPTRINGLPGDQPIASGNPNSGPAGDGSENDASGYGGYPPTYPSGVEALQLLEDLNPFGESGKNSTPLQRRR